MTSTFLRMKSFASARHVLRGMCLCFIFVVHPLAVAFDGGKLSQAVRREEALLKARIGLAVMDVSDGSRWDFRGDETFPLNSTHKALSCAALLFKVDRLQIALSQRVTVEPTALVTYSPVVEKHVAPQSLTLQDLCAAAVSYSDNTAANVITDAIGGPAAFTEFMRTIGDRQTRLDRKEPELNEATPNDVRDTTTPNAIVDSLQKILLGDVLSGPSKALLTDWMQQDKVADALLRAALPKSWVIADKSGAGGYGSRSIVAVIWPSARPPVVISVYITQTAAPMTDSNAAIARIGKALVEVIEKR